MLHKSNPLISFFRKPKAPAEKPVLFTARPEVAMEQVHMPFRYDYLVRIVNALDVEKDRDILDLLIPRLVLMEAKHE